MKQRLAGLASFAAGAFAFYLYVYRPLEAARRHEEKVPLFLEPEMLCPVFLIWGVIALVYGETTPEVFGTRKRPKPVSVLLAILSIIAGLVLYLGLRMKLEEAGYQFD